VDFETRNDVTVEEYLKMIEFKTAVLVGAAMKMGAIIAEASEADQNSIYAFGKNLGIAFQLQDDYLDAFGDSATFGKQVGGDIIENKKTYLYLKTLEFSDAKTKEELLNLFEDFSGDPKVKVDRVKEIFSQSGAQEATKEAIGAFTKKAYSELDSLKINEEQRKLLVDFGEQLMNRQV
jgi:geranylgeranyl diphosphate synthase type II